MNRYLIAFLLFFGFCGIYYLGSFGKIPFGDCVGFVLTTEKGEFVAETTSTVHFLYVNTLVLIKKVFPFFTSEDVTALVSGISAAGVVSVLYLISKKLLQRNWVAVTTAVLFGFSFSFWRNAEIPEVYTFNAFFVVLFLFQALMALKENASRHLCFSALILGIGLWVHIQNILLIPGFLYLVFSFREKLKEALIAVFTFSLIFLGLFLQPFMDNEPLMTVLKSGIWVENSLTKGASDYAEDIFVAILYLIYNFWHFTLFGIYGVFHLFKKDRHLLLLLLILALPTFGFATFYEVSDNYVFFISFNLIFALLAGFGMNNAMRLKPVIAISVLLIPLFYYTALKIAPEFEKGRSFHETKAYKGGLDYYLTPWMHSNVGIIEFTIEKRTAPEPVIWMTVTAEEYIDLLKKKGYKIEQIQKL